MRILLVAYLDEYRELLERALAALGHEAAACACGTAGLPELTSGRRAALAGLT